MDHTIDKLDECIFDYLASNPDRYIHYRQIFQDITGETGHRCTELTDSTEDRRYFLAVAYSMNNQYKNVRKHIRDRDLYLAFERDEVDMNPEKYRGKPWTGLPFTTVIDHIFTRDMHHDFDEEYYYETFEKEPLLHEMIRYGVANRTVRNLIEEMNLDIDVINDHQQTPLDVAIAVQNTDMVKFLVRLADERTRKLEERSKPPAPLPIVIEQKSNDMSTIQTLKYSVIAFGLGFGTYVGYSAVTVLSSLF
jgi:hypothetical protein